MKNCENCGIEHDGKYGSGRFCSTKCSRGFSTKAKRKEINEKVSKTLTGKSAITKQPTEYEYSTCPLCGDIFSNIKNHKRKKKYCSKACSLKRKKTQKEIENNRKTMLEKVKNGTHKGWSSRKILSYPEKFFKKVLELNGYKDFAINYKIRKKDLGIECNSNYFLDFYFEKYKLDLEIDGKQHDYIERKKSDAFRDEKLLMNGYNVYRIKWKSINSEKGKSYIKKEIEKFFNHLKDLEKTGTVTPNSEDF